MLNGTGRRAHMHQASWPCSSCRLRTIRMGREQERSDPPMARRPAPPPKPTSPTLTVGQTRRRIERLQKCVAKLEAFDPQKARKRAPAVLELEATIDKALSSAFGYGTPACLRCTQAATLDPSPLLGETAARPNAPR